MTIRLCLCSYMLNSKLLRVCAATRPSFRLCIKASPARPASHSRRPTSAAKASMATVEHRAALPAAAAAAAPIQLVKPLEWRSLGTPALELRLEHTLPTGQSFRWRQTAADEFTGVVGARVVRLRQLEDDVQYAVLARGTGADAAEDHAALADYFNLSTSLAALAARWAAADPLFASLHPNLPGARMLRQDPLECLLSFICSQVGLFCGTLYCSQLASVPAPPLACAFHPAPPTAQNNHISRIHGMVERFCRVYGTPLLAADHLQATSIGSGSSADGSAAAAAPGTAGVALYAFPSLDQLAGATEEALRSDGFGYRSVPAVCALPCWRCPCMLKLV